MLGYKKIFFLVLFCSIWLQVASMKNSKIKLELGNILTFSPIRLLSDTNQQLMNFLIKEDECKIMEKNKNFALMPNAHSDCLNKCELKVVVFAKHVNGVVSRIFVKLNDELRTKQDPKNLKIKLKPKETKSKCVQNSSNTKYTCRCYFNSQIFGSKRSVKLVLKRILEILSIPEKNEIEKINEFLNNNICTLKLSKMIVKNDNNTTNRINIVIPPKKGVQKVNPKKWDRKLERRSDTSNVNDLENGELPDSERFLKLKVKFGVRLLSVFVIGFVGALSLKYTTVLFPLTGILIFYQFLMMYLSLSIFG